MAKRWVREDNCSPAWPMASSQSGFGSLWRHSCLRLTERGRFAPKAAQLKNGRGREAGFWFLETRRSGWWGLLLKLKLGPGSQGDHAGAMALTGLRCGSPELDS